MDSQGDGDDLEDSPRPRRNLNQEFFSQTSNFDPTSSVGGNGGLLGRGFGVGHGLDLNSEVVDPNEGFRSYMDLLQSPSILVAADGPVGGGIVGAARGEDLDADAAGFGRGIPPARGSGGGSTGRGHGAGRGLGRGHVAGGHGHEGGRGHDAAAVDSAALGRDVAPAASTTCARGVGRGDGNGHSSGASHGAGSGRGRASRHGSVGGRPEIPTSAIPYRVPHAAATLATSSNAMNDFDEEVDHSTWTEQQHEEDDFNGHDASGKFEWRMLKKGPPENLEEIAIMFQHTALDGPTACTPGDNLDTATVTSPRKRIKSPMVRIMKGIWEDMKEANAVAQKATQGDYFVEQVKEYMRLVVASGSPAGSAAHFVVGQLFVKPEHRGVFVSIEDNEGRQAWLRRWCQGKNIH
ncbi:hypothetical protein PR202_ga31439 [Eleusine coracana subsp. coracana]|uniref:Uncharacterized protein n=1 Tax=Eleusine coracana subsp. coracana TaxID=191504 RepID=A0AAV5DT61_ELECO|nr:hypothetical protein PR202_ga31439 [Eleusine coracana subsp. coracana]